jgi:hypothetical protein
MRKREDVERPLGKLERMKLRWEQRRELIARIDAGEASWDDLREFDATPFA